jgi:LPXTG-motif cell wall-anchored protein
VSTLTDTVFFAPASETAQMTDWVYLGLLYSGGDAELEIKLDVPVTLGNDYADKIGYLDWEFMIEEFPVEDTDPKPAPTGEGMEVFVALGLMLVFGALLIVMVIRKKKA